MNGQFKQHKQCLIALGLIGLVGCQSLPTSDESKQPAKPVPTEKQDIKTPSGVVITPYEREEIQRKKMQVIVPAQQQKDQKTIQQAQKALNSL